LAYYYVRYTSLAVPVRVPTQRDLAWVSVGVVVPLAVQIGLILVGSRLGVQPVAGGVDAAGAANPELVYSLAHISALFLIGPVEELLCRGVVQGRLRQSLGPVAANGFTSVGFAAGHVATLFWGGGDPFTLGFGLSVVAIASGISSRLFSPTACSTASSSRLRWPACCEPVATGVQCVGRSSLIEGTAQGDRAPMSAEWCSVSVVTEVDFCE
jgi:membrane protease YdiL (CAAX protease family)